VPACHVASTLCTYVPLRLSPFRGPSVVFEERVLPEHRVHAVQPAAVLHPSAVAPAASAGRRPMPISAVPWRRAAHMQLVHFRAKPGSAALSFSRELLLCHRRPHRAVQMTSNRTPRAERQKPLTHLSHIRAGTGAHSPPHPRRDWDRPCHTAPGLDWLVSCMGRCRRGREWGQCNVFTLPTETALSLMISTLRPEPPCLRPCAGRP
jgi:hypothetical protein